MQRAANGGWVYRNISHLSPFFAFNCIYIVTVWTAHVFVIGTIYAVQTAGFCTLIRLYRYVPLTLVNYISVKFFSL